MADQALDGLKVLDLGCHIAGPYCTKLLADYGAEVIKLEHPDNGDPARKEAPFPGDEPGFEKSGLFLFLNNNKKSITLNLKTESGKKYFKELVKWADILVENFSPRVMPALGLNYEKLKAINPALVMVSISNFGQSGPYRDYQATDIVLQALGGWLLFRGDPRRKPVKAAGMLRISEFIGGAFGAASTLTGLAHQRRTGSGQHVDVSLMEAVAQMNPFPWACVKFPATLWPPIRHIYIPGIEECKDGYIGLNVMTGQHWVDLCGLMEMYELAEDENYMLVSTRIMHAQEVKDRIRPWLMARTRKEIQEEAIDWRVPATMVYTSEDIVQSQHLQERGYMVEVAHPVMGRLKQPGPPARMSETPWTLRTPAPMLGEHNGEIYCRLGVDREGTVRLRQAGVI